MPNKNTLKIIVPFLLFAALGNGCKLVGGSSKNVELSIETGVGTYIRNISTSPDDSSLTQALQHTVAHGADNESFVQTFGRIYVSENPSRKLASLFAFNRNTTDTNTATTPMVLTLLNEKVNYVVNSTNEILTNRLKAIGVTNIKSEIDKHTGNIKLSFTASQDTAKLREYLSQPGKIQLFETYKNEDFFTFLDFANTKLSEIGIAEVAAEEKKQLAERRAKEADKAPTDTGFLRQAAAHTRIAHEEDNFKRQNVLFSVMMPVTLSSGSQLAPGPIVGYVLLKDTALLMQYLGKIANKTTNSESLNTTFPTDVKFLFGKTDTSKVLTVYAVKLTAKGGAALEGSIISSAGVRKSPDKKKLSIYWQMTEYGTNKWAELTEDNIGKYLAIVVDGVVLSCPRVSGAISSGETEISGDFNEEDATQLASILNLGRLPLSVNITKLDIK